jgi:hypothetical protein
MPNRTILTPLVGFILIVYSVLTFHALPTWKSINGTAGIVGIFVVLWDYYFWRVPWLYPKIVPLPNIRGTWSIKGKIFRLPSAPQKSGIVEVPYEVIDGHIIIRQTGSGFKFTALWDDASTSIMHYLAPVTGNDGWGAFVGQYVDRDANRIGIAGVIVYSTAHPTEPIIYYTTIETVPQRGVTFLTNRIRQFCETREEVAALPADSDRRFLKKAKYLVWPW